MTSTLIAGPNVNDSSGFGDVIVISEAYFCAAQLLGLDVEFCPLSADRSGAGVFDALRVNSAMERRLRRMNPVLGKVRSVELPTLESNTPDLQRWISDHLPERDTTNRVVFSLPVPRKLNALRFVDASLRTHRDLQSLGDYFSLPAEFSAANEHVSLFTTDNLRILLHVRRGDIALFDLGAGRTFTPWGMNGEIKPAVVDDPTKLTQPYVSDERYLAMINALRQELGNTPAEIVVVSDGHDRGARILAGSTVPGLMSPEEREEVHALSARLDRRMSDTFSREIGARCFIGEVTPSMVEVCATAAAADIVISLSGGFLASALRYFRSSNRPLLGVVNDMAKAIIELGGRHEQSYSAVSVNSQNLEAEHSKITAAAALFLVKLQAVRSIARRG